MVIRKIFCPIILPVKKKERKKELLLGDHSFLLLLSFLFIYIDSLASYFSRFGEVTDSIIMMDWKTQKPRGFGFVTFSDPNVCRHVIGTEHVLDNRRIEVKLADGKRKEKRTVSFVYQCFIYFP